jgi:CDP-2,3-bis-(O-geranylgeranyl)-sn-glycerol synthase
MWSDIWQGALLASPLLIGLVVHGLCIKLKLLPALAVPIDRGASFRGRRLFGDNKTYRGIVAMGLGSGLGFLLLGQLAAGGRHQHLSQLPAGPIAALLGVAVGMVAMLAELPNSTLKRQLDLPPGEQMRGLPRIAFHVLDQVDIWMGAWLVLAFVVSPTFGLLAGSFLWIYRGHQVFTYFGYRLGMRATRH